MSYFIEINLVQKIRQALALISLLCPLASLGNELPSAWEGFTNSSSFHCIILPKNVIPVIENNAIDSADYIGVFFYDDGVLRCGGAAEYSPNENISIFAYGNDPFVQGKNGFYSGDSIYWKVYSFKDNVEIDITFIKYKEGEHYITSGVFTNLGVSIIDCISAGIFTANAFASVSETCENSGILISCSPQGGSGNYSYQWESTPQGIVSNAQSFECQITETTLFSVNITDISMPQNPHATAYVRVFYIPPPQIIFSSDTTACISEPFIELEPTISNYSSIQWRASGDGYFEDNINAITKYYFGSFDISNSGVNLFLEVKTTQPCFYEITKTISIALNDDKIVFAGHDISIFEGEYAELSAKVSCFTEDYEINWQPDTLLYANNILNPQTIPLYYTTDFILTITDLSTYTTFKDTVTIKVIPQNSLSSTHQSTSIYPNPFQERLNILCDEAATINIYNLLGEKVLRECLPAGKNIINTSKLNIGMYFVEVFRGSSREVMKMVKSTE